MDIPKPKIIRSNRASISLQVDDNGELIVKAPRLMPKFLINKFINEKSEWIKKALSKVNKIKNTKKNYKEGETFLFLGKEYSLHLGNYSEIFLDNNNLNFPKVLFFRIEKELRSWYIKNAKEKINQRLKLHAVKMNRNYTEVFFSDTKSKWGTCFHDNSLQFNWRLIMAPIVVIDYVIIHELTHTKEKNHSIKFWNNVKLFTPAYKQHRKWLKDNGRTLVI